MYKTYDLFPNIVTYIRRNSNRFILFLLGCVGLRIGMGIFIKSRFCSGIACYILSIAIALIGCGFMVIYFGGLRKTGVETGGNRIWWNHLRPFHGLLYLVVAWLLFNGLRENKKMAGNLIIVDAVIGLIAWMLYHIYQIMSI